MIKTIINYSSYTDSTLNPTAQGGHDAMTLNAKTFPNPPVALADLQTQIDTYHAALATALSTPSQANTMAKNAAKAALAGSLAQLGGYVNIIAQGDMTVIIQSGLPYYDTQNAPLPAVRPAPQNLVLAQDVRSGYIDAACTPFKPSDAQSVETCTSDPTVEANWVHALSFIGSSVTVGPFTPGIMVWVRWRSNGPGGVHGNWSSVAQLRVV